MSGMKMVPSVGVVPATDVNLFQGPGREHRDAWLIAVTSGIHQTLRFLPLPEVDRLSQWDQSGPVRAYRGRRQCASITRLFSAE